jgi:hypothetical protein
MCPVNDRLPVTEERLGRVPEIVPLRTPRTTVVTSGGPVRWRVINFRRSAWTLGASPLVLDDDRFLNEFLDLFAVLVSETSGND